MKINFDKIYMTFFIIINFNEIYNILEIIKKEALENYKHVLQNQIHQISMSYMTNHTKVIGKSKILMVG